jgi:hypothetical protein
LLAQNFQLLSLDKGLIPTETRISFRVDVPFRKYIAADNQVLKNDGLPIYYFTTKDLAMVPYGTPGNSSSGSSVMEKVRIVPNPYYGSSGYEQNRLDNRVYITNLPNRATISIYSMDGTLIRRLEHAKTESTSQGYEAWDIRNSKGLQIAGGMYLIHVSSPGYGESVIKWFGAMRPADIISY